MPERHRTALAIAVVLTLFLAWNVYRAQVERRPAMPGPSSVTIPEYGEEPAATTTGPEPDPTADAPMLWVGRPASTTETTSVVSP